MYLSLKNTTRFIGTTLCVVVLFVGALGEQLGYLYSDNQSENHVEAFQIQAIEPNWSVAAVSPRQRIINQLRVSLDRFDSLCVGVKDATDRVAFQDIARNPSKEAIMTLQSYCLVGGETRSHHQKYNGDVSITIAEAIKIVTKIVSLGENVSFDEFGWYPGYLPYTDILPNARYASYVVYADARGYLDGVIASKIFGRNELKALTPMKKKQIVRLFKNAGKESSQHPIMKQSGLYISRNDFAELVTDAFSDELIDYRIMYGNNHVIYRWLLTQLSGKTIDQQHRFLRTVITTFEQLDQEVIGWKYNIHLPGLVAFLKSLE